QMTAFATTTVKHNLAAEKIGLHRIQPAQQLLAILIIMLIEVCPLPTKARGGRRFFGADLGQVGKPRNAARNGKFATTTFAPKSSFHDFVRIFGRDVVNLNFSLTRGTGKIFEKSFFHAGWLLVAGVALRRP